MKVELDGMDARILDILQADARTTLAEIGRRIHMSQPAWRSASGGWKRPGSSPVIMPG
jgi:DNA-binding Lrp family transcriptional regulator